MKHEGQTDEILQYSTPVVVLASSTANSLLN